MEESNERYAGLLNQKDFLEEENPYKVGIDFSKLKPISSMMGNINPKWFTGNKVVYREEKALVTPDNVLVQIYEEASAFQAATGQRSKLVYLARDAYAYYIISLRELDMLSDDGDPPSSFFGIKVELNPYQDASILAK